MPYNELIPHLFRTEYRKLVSVLCRLFGLSHIEIAEDIVSDTFLLASETWGLKGLPQNPTAWLYTVAKNKALDVVRRNRIFTEKVVSEVNHTTRILTETEINLSDKNISDSQLQMLFAVCNPCIFVEAQIRLSLNLLCGFGAEEIADAFLSNKEVIYKRLSRAKEKLRIENIKIELPPPSEINNRLEAVLSTMYLLFTEGYYSASQNISLRKDLCLEAMRLTFFLTEYEQTNTPAVKALLALMCFHTSRFEARLDDSGEIILYDDQDETLWNIELIEKGEYYLNQASTGNKLSKYHLEAAIAYWHTNKNDTLEKWENILQLYNKLLQIEYSPFAALNRTFALSKARGKQKAIIEAEKLSLSDNHLYYTLLAELYTGIADDKALHQLQKALACAKRDIDKKLIRKKIAHFNKL